MGYTTYYSGELTLNKPITSEHRVYLERFAYVRHCKRDEAKLARGRQGQVPPHPDPVRVAVGLPVGKEGCFYVAGDMNADDGHAVTDSNKPPAGQPSLHCPFHPSEKSDTLEVFDEGANCEEGTEWLKWLIKHILGPWGYTLNGTIGWDGDDDDDRGTIYVKDNRVEMVEDTIMNPGPSWTRKVDLSGLTPEQRRALKKRIEAIDEEEALKG